MLLIECDGKALFAEFGIALPEGVVASSTDLPAPLPGSGPWIVKAQVPIGGRGKAGGIVRCETGAEVEAAVERLIGRRIRNRPVELCLVERAVHGEEAYLSVMLDAGRGCACVMYSDEGGVDIELAAREEGRIRREWCPADPDSVRQALAGIAATLDPARRPGLEQTGARLAALFFERELVLAEINPLFWTPDGPVAGDAKVVADINALSRQPWLHRLVLGRASIYDDVHRKIAEGFDYIEIDPGGSIGLLTTGAGLSMMLIDELVALGARPINFCDVRTGQLRGKSDRIVRILEWLSDRPGLKVVFCNIFAGITDLAEFADLLVDALRRCPGVAVPLVVRLVGNGEAEAIRILADKRPDIAVFSDLDAATARTIELANR